ncbi:hypothetical protein ACI3EY_16670 [Ornithinimicrobium sp. LYQ92]|uniref:hypothetical protein n=1 Tax=Serinicoccus sp. LYQ92 TaxID=3378798 RepID=UPI00385414B7
MSNYQVVTVADETVTVDADKYTIDEHGILHLYVSSGPRAAFAPGRWSSVVEQQG